MEKYKFKLYINDIIKTNNFKQSKKNINNKISHPVLVKKTDDNINLCFPISRQGKSIY